MTLSPPTVIVLDRDGVINRGEGDSIRTPADWEALPGSLEAIAELHRAGFVLAIITNQPGVGRGLFSLDALWDVHRAMLARILAAGGFIQRIFFCLHAPEDRCNCRMPEPGLLFQIAEYFACGFKHMVVIGDSAADIAAARAAGARAILVRSGEGRAAEASWVGSDLPEVHDDLTAVSVALIRERVGLP